MIMNLCVFWSKEAVILSPSDRLWAMCRLPYFGVCRVAGPRRGGSQGGFINFDIRSAAPGRYNPGFR